MLRRTSVAAALCFGRRGVHVLVVRQRAVTRPPASPAASRAASPAAAALNPAPSPEALGFDSQRLAKLDAYMAKVVADGRVAGMSTLLARHGQVVSEKIYGVKSLATGADDAATPSSASTPCRSRSPASP